MSSLPDYETALGKALSVVDRLRTRRVSLEAAAGSVLAAPVVADRDLPPFNRAMMDGYALRAADLKPGAALPVAGEVPAGADPNVDVPVGSCVRIATGAAVPRACDTVIQHELSDRSDPVSFTIDTIERGHAIHPRAADARAGDELIAAGTSVAAQHVGIAAAAGVTRLEVYSLPRVTILTSGDEVVPPDARVLDHQIRNSNGPMLMELLRRFGARESEHAHLADEPEATINAIAQAVEASDLTITVGGVSAGERDYFPLAFERARVVMTLAGAAIQPGKPIHAGRAPNGSVVVGLPGNPVSVLATAHLFVWPIVRAMMGMRAELSWIASTLAAPVHPNPRRRAFRPAHLNDDGTVTVPKWAGSGDLAHTATTHGLVALPVRDDAVGKGESVPFLRWA